MNTGGPAFPVPVDGATDGRTHDGGQAVKGTPMVYAMMKFCFGTDEEFVRIKDAAKLERELNAANERIKQLEEAGNDLVWWFCQGEPSQLSSMQSVALKRWRDLRGGRNP